MFVLKHRDLPVPLVLSSEAHAAVKDAVRRKEQVVVLGDYILNVAMMSVIPQEQFLASDTDELAKRGKARCRWGMVYAVEGRHDCRETSCARNADRNSPFVWPATWGYHEQDVLAADAFRTGDRTALRASVQKLEERFAAGELVLRELVRIYRKDGGLLSDDMITLLEQFSAVPLSSVPDLTITELYDRSK